MKRASGRTLSKKRIKLAFSVLILTLALPACSSDDAGKKQETELTEDELAGFTRLFNTDEYKGFLRYAFSKPEEIDWKDIIEQGAIAQKGKCSEEQIDDYLKIIGKDIDEVYRPCYSFKKSDVADFVKRHSGLDRVPAIEQFYWKYIKKYESYFSEYFIEDKMVYKCISGKKSEDGYVLRFQAIDGLSEIHSDRLLTVTKAGDDYVMVSNEFLKNCYYDKQSFELDVYSNETPIAIDVVYSELDLDSYDGDPCYETSFVANINTIAKKNIARFGCKVKVLAVDSYDYNADNRKDAVFIIESDEGKQVLMFDGETLCEFASYDKDELAKIGADFTIDSIRSAMDKINTAVSGDEGYKKAYAELAKTELSEIEDLRFKLIYVDDDDIPELSIDYLGYRQSVYAYKNGEVKEIFCGSYGVHGCGGYYYSPKKGVFSTFCTEYAGLMYDDIYYSISETGEAKEDCYRKGFNYDDLDGDGEPSEEEGRLAQEGKGGGKIEYHSSLDENIPESEVKARFEQYESYDADSVAGGMDYIELLSELAKEPEEDPGTAVYETFLNGESTVSFDYYMENIFNDCECLLDADKNISLIDTDKEYTLSGLVDSFKDAFAKDSNKDSREDIHINAKYSYLDCGADGEKELAVELDGPFSIAELHAKLTFVIKELDGKLQVIYAFPKREGNDNEINEYGLIWGKEHVDSEVYKTDVRYINSDGKYIFGYHDHFDRLYNPVGLYTDEHILWLDEYDQNEEEYPYYVENVEYGYYSMYSEIGSYDAPDPYYEDEPDYKKEGAHYKEYDSENIEDVLPAKQVDLYENRYVNNRIEYYDEFVHHIEGSLKNKEDYYTAKAERLRSIGVTGKILNGLPLTFEVIVPR